MIRVELSKIIIDERKREQVIVLKEQSGDRVLPIVIGINEAAAIKMELSGFRPPRPMTHDLMKAVFDTFEITLDKVVIDDLVDNTFHAKLYLRPKGDGVKIVDARPSDSIALAVRAGSPVFVEESVFNRSFWREYENRDNF